MQKYLISLIAILCLSHSPTRAFVAPLSSQAAQHSSGLWELKAEASKADLTASEEKVYNILEEIHSSKLAFRTVVVGNGAILESTNVMGPVLKLGQSPKSGANIATFASEDQSFEFHVMTAQVKKIALTEKESPATGRTMRILRLTKEDAKPICSLILADDTDEAATWYKGIVSKYGEEIEL